MFFVNTDVFTAARTVFLVKVGFEGRVAIFPSDALLVKFCLYLCDGSLLCYVVSVRRREDAEGDRNSGVKVQVCCWKWRLDLVRPFEMLIQIERKQDIDSCFS
jgi:hypothetical protein